MNIPRSFIDTLLQRVDIVELINPYVPLRKKSGSNYFARCPFHNEKSASFSVSQPKQFYYCFGCGAHGNALDFLMQHEHLSFPEAIESLAGITGLPIPQESGFSSKESHFPILFEVMEKAKQFYMDRLKLSPKAIAYLKSRGITGEIAKRFNLGYAPAEWSALLDQLAPLYDKKILLECGLIIRKNESNNYYDRFRDRIIFPIHDFRGRIIGFGGRILDQGEPKYLNSPETPLFQKGHELYGLYHALKTNRKLKSMLIVEGYMDAIALYQHGITNVIATLGTATTAHHIKRLSRYTNELIFCFDGDAAGRTAAWRAVQTLLPLLHDEIQVRFLFLPEKEDPDSLIRKAGKEAFLSYLKDAQSLSMFLFQTLAKDNDLSSIEGRARFAALAAQHIKEIPSGMYQNILFEELSKRARIDLHHLNPQARPDKNARFNSPARTIKADLKTLTPIRRAIMLLLQNPQLNEEVTELLPVTNPGSTFFNQVIEIIRNDPNITTGRLIEHWRGEKEEQYVASFAKMQHMIPEQGIKSEFLGVMRQLLAIDIEEEINRLLAKAALEGLTQDEKQALTTEIRKKKTLQTENR